MCLSWSLPRQFATPRLQARATPCKAVPKWRNSSSPVPEAAQPHVNMSQVGKDFPARAHASAEK